MSSTCCRRDGALRQRCGVAAVCRMPSSSHRSPFVKLSSSCSVVSGRSSLASMGGRVAKACKLGHAIWGQGGSLGAHRAGSFTGSVTGGGTGVGRGATRAGGGRTGSVVGSTSIRRRSGPISPNRSLLSSRAGLCISVQRHPLVGATHHCLFRSPVAAFSGSAATADESLRCPSAAPLVAVITCRV